MINETTMSELNAAKDRLQVAQAEYFSALSEHDRAERNALSEWAALRDNIKRPLQEGD